VESNVGLDLNLLRGGGGAMGKGQELVARDIWPVTSSKAKRAAKSAMARHSLRLAKRDLVIVLTHHYYRGWFW
jgi:hypothetical protein